MTTTTKLFTLAEYLALSPPLLVIVRASVVLEIVLVQGRGNLQSAIIHLLVCMIYEMILNLIKSDRYDDEELLCHTPLQIYC
jgi:hypothetical protein